LRNAPGQVHAADLELRDRQLTQSIRDAFKGGFENFFVALQQGQGAQGFKGLTQGIAGAYQQAQAQVMTRKFIEPLLDKIPYYKASKEIPQTAGDILLSRYLEPMYNELQSINRNTGGSSEGSIGSYGSLGLNNFSGAANKSFNASSYSDLGLMDFGAQNKDKYGNVIKYDKNGKPIKLDRNGRPIRGHTLEAIDKYTGKAMQALGYYSAGKSAYDAGAQGGPLMGAVGGAISGSAFGPVGTIVGSVLGLFGGLFGRHHKPKEPKEYDDFWTPKDVMWSAPGYRPFSAFAGGRSMAGAPMKMDINLNVTGMSGSQYEGAISAAVRLGVTQGVGKAYSRERQLGAKSGINA
jgi:hypothetical protein